MEVTKLLGIIILHVALLISHECSPCFCCKQGNGCSYNVQFGLDNYCYEGCINGYMSPLCQKPCVNQRCQTCSTETACDTCYGGNYGDQCLSSCPSTCNTCTSITLCTSCRDGYHIGSGTTCVYKCKIQCLSCTNGTSCTACKVKSGIGYHGSDCSMPCSNKCKDYQCDIHGNCIQCARDEFGRRCNNSCSSCKHNHCPEDRLNALKCDECTGGTYGNFCNETCPQHCLNNVCDQGNGACECDVDYHFQNGKCIPTYCPVNCSTCTSLANCTSCTDNYHYGDTCEYECTHCKSGTTCRKIDGYCWSACADGLTAPRCDIPCFKGCAACHRSLPGECTSLTWSQDKDEKSVGYSRKTVGIMSGVIAVFAIAFAFSVGIVVYMKRKLDVFQRDMVKERHMTGNSSVEEASNYEQLQERTDQPNYQNVNENKYDVLFANSSL